MLENLREQNPHIHIYSVNDAEFLQYGRVLPVDAFEMIEAAEKIALPETGSIYEASNLRLEGVWEVREVLEKEIYGEMPIQIGSCRGFNNALNGFEYHVGSEVNVAVTPMLLFLANQWDFKNGKLDTKDAKAFFVDKGQVIQVYETTLHMCPCNVVDSGFHSIVVLPKGTNTDLEEKHADPYLFRKNKWIFCHIDNEALKARGVKPGIVGENYQIKAV